MILDLTLGRQCPLKFLGVKRADSQKIASNINFSDYSWAFFNLKSILTVLKVAWHKFCRKAPWLKFQ